MAYQVSVEEYCDTYRIVDQERYTALICRLFHPHSPVN